ncbi:MAG: DUF1800 domain-containing protein [bacterium]|nr:DUF1800 domain-containing protein [bacterium]
MYSERERTAHVIRRLGLGSNPRLVAEHSDPASAIAAMLDLPFDQAQLPQVDPPADWDSVDYSLLGEHLMPWWMDVIGSGEQPLIERLVWFWHDHFAISGEKADNSYILLKHHETIRANATGNFRAMLSAVISDAAMLWYLDAIESTAGTPNENLGRELMELHTLGVGNYTEEDVKEISRALTGWVINEPHWEEPGFQYDYAPPWVALLDPERHDTGTKTLLGNSGTLGLADVAEILLDRPETGRHVAAKLYKEIIGLDAPPATAQRLGKKFAETYDIMPLVREIVADPAFLSDEAIRAKVRSPLEKVATILQGLPLAEDNDPSSVHWILNKLNYLPLHAPNPAGFPSGEGLLDPARLLGSFELLYLVRNLDDEEVTAIDVFEALGVYDVSTETRALIDRFPRPGLQLGLAFGSPEFMVV